MVNQAGEEKKFLEDMTPLLADAGVIRKNI
jgi:hypothetical protein